MEKQEWVDKAADRRSSGLSHSLRSLSHFNRCGTHLVVNSRICRHILNSTDCFTPECLNHALAFILLLFPSSLPSCLRFVNSVSIPGIMTEKSQYCKQQVKMKAQSQKTLLFNFQDLALLCFHSANNRPCFRENT